MIRFLFRLVGYWLLAGVLVAAIIDGSKSIAESSLVTTQFGQHFQQLAPTLLQRLEYGIQNNLGQPWLWDVVFVNILAWPSFLVLGVLTLIFLMIGRPKRTYATTEDGF